MNSNKQEHFLSFYEVITYQNLIGVEKLHLECKQKIKTRKNQQDSYNFSNNLDFLII